MNTIVILVICVVLFSIFLQDWKFRKIHILLPVFLFILSYWEVTLFSTAIHIQLILTNILFFSIIFLSLVLYMTSKYKKMTNPFSTYFGLGDLLFYISISPLFVLKNYIIFFTASMVFAIVMQAVVLKKAVEKSIPLAGFSSLLLLVVIGFEALCNNCKITLLV